VIELPDVARKALEADGAVAFATASKDGTPNVIYASCTRLLDGGRFAIADNYFDKTGSNIAENRRVAVAAGSEEVGSIQIKGTCTRLTEGPEHEDMFNWVSEDMPRRAVVVIEIDEVYNGAKRLA